MNDLFANFLLGLNTALIPANIGYCFIGVFLGMLVGVLPGIGALAAISMLFPITFHLHPASALMMLAGIYYGTAYGGSTTSILLNVPGDSSSSVACLDGYPMSQQGRSGVALLLTTLASFFAASCGILIMMLFSPLIVNVALKFGDAEYFSLMLLGLVAASTISSGSAIKGIAMVVVGIAIGTTGMDMYTGVPRFTFDMMELWEGITIVAVATGLFGVTEVITSVRTVKPGQVDRKSVSFRSMIPTRDDLRRFPKAAIRGTAVGAFFGTLPGTGPTIASFMAYALEKRVAKDPSRFGRGAVEGVIAPEAANNAADQTAFIPTMTLGIPGSATMALILGVLIVHGINPGPRLMMEKPEIFWGLVMSFWVGNILLLILNIPLIGIWIRLLQVPYTILYPAIMMFVCIGVYSINNSAFDVWLVVGFGALGYAMRLLDFPPAPLILGFVLGHMMEEHFRRAMILSNGDFATFVDRPISGTILALTVALLGWGVWSALKARRGIVTVATEEA